MKKVLSLIILALIFSVRLLQDELEKSRPATTPTPVAQVVDAQTMTADSYLVTRVVDGDTIEVNVHGKIERVRYIGVNTPETVDPRRSVECFGREASDKNKALVGGRMVALVRDVSDRDKYGRLLRYVYIGDLFINLKLVQDGYAHASSYPPDLAHQADFRAAQTEARAARRGLWGSCY